MEDFTGIRKRVYDAAMNLYHSGLIRLSAGNVSARVNEELIAITPSGRPYTILQPEDNPIISLDRKLVDGAYRPSSESPLHTTIYREMPEVGGIVHTHSIYAITFAASNKPLPVLCVEGLATFSDGPIPVARYVSPGSPHAGEVAMEVFRAKPGLKALLLKNHGLLAIGQNVEAAWETAYNIETAAQIAYQAYAIGNPIELTMEQIEEVYKIYGMRR